METLVERATRLGIETATVGEMLDEIEQLREKVDYLADGMRNVFPAAHRLALELECLLLDTKDTVAVSKWWDSGNEALEQWREFCREDEKLGAGGTATISALEAEIEAAEFAEAERQIQTGGF